MSTLAEMRLAATKVTYSDAINRYNTLKKIFYQQLNYVAQEETNNASKEFLNEIISDIQRNPVEDQELLMRDMLMHVEETIRAELAGHPKKRDLARQLLSEAKNKEVSANQNFSMMFNRIFDEYQLKDYIVTRLGLSGSQFNVQDILNQVKSFRNKMISDLRKSGKDYNIRSGKGFVREAIIYKGFGKLQNYFDIQGGHNIDPKTNLQSIYDIYMNKLNSYKNINIPIDFTFDGFGIQSKSWAAPWEQKSSWWQTKYGYSVGSRSDLLSMFTKGNKNIGGLWYWYKSIAELERYTTDIIGQDQVAYVTGKNFIWTADLITQFRKEGYRLAFGLGQNNKLTPRIAWQNLDK